MAGYVTGLRLPVYMRAQAGVGVPEDAVKPQQKAKNAPKIKIGGVKHPYPTPSSHGPNTAKLLLRQNHDVTHHRSRKYSFRALPKTRQGNGEIVLNMLVMVEVVQTCTFPHLVMLAMLTVVHVEFQRL